MDRQCIFIFCLISVVVSVEVSVEDTFPTPTTVKTSDDRTPPTIKPVKEEIVEDDVKGDAIKSRTVLRTVNSNIKDNCCGAKHGSSVRSAESIVRNGDYDVRLSHSERMFARYGNHPEERYGWQNYPARLGQNGLYGQGNPDRYAQRPAYLGDNNYAGSHRPGTSYGDNRPHGTSVYGKPSNSASGSYSDNGEYNGPDHAHQEVAGPIPPGMNIHTQKAVALKALAGVALIGAAAALATNPVLMPLGMISGRRKRSEDTNQDDHYQDEHSSQMLNNFISQVKQRNAEDRKFAVTPHCVARLACEVQKDYIADLKKNEEILNQDKETLRSLELWFIDLIRRNILDVDYVSVELKKLIKLAVSIGSSDQNCRIFPCDIVKD